MSAQLATGNAIASASLLRVDSMTAMTSKTALNGDACLLIIEGEVDCANADELTATGLRALEDVAVQTVAVDLAGVSFCDAAALGALVRIRNASLERDKVLMLRSVSTPVARLLRLTELDSAFTIAPTHG
jgi:anti-anti-sigma factor